MRAGDKVICINGCRGCFKLNETYTVTSVSLYTYEIEHFSFRIRYTTGYYDFSNHFISLKEQRKEKINKIYEITQKFIQR